MVKNNRPIYTPKNRKKKNFLSESKFYLTGKYTKTEIDYLDSLIILFHNKMLNIEHNYPLRLFLADCIGRNIMSISKKFTHDKKIGKQRYNLPILLENKNYKDNKDVILFKKRRNKFKKNISNNNFSMKVFEKIQPEFVINKILWPTFIGESISYDNKINIKDIFNESEINKDPVFSDFDINLNPIFSDSEFSILVQI